MNPYEELGIEPDADAATIKAAYRKEAQASHPDKEGGSTESFQLVRTAFDILKDPDARARYDDTGETGEPSPIEVRFDQLLTNAINSGNWSADIVDEMRRQISSALASIVIANNTHGQEIYALKQKKGRIVMNGVPVQLIERKLQSKIEHLESVVAANDVETTVLEGVLEEKLSKLSDSRVMSYDMEYSVTLR
jgi:curved DNA-binding protein CbpA